MSLLDYFRSSKKSSTAATAKERLQIIVAHQRGERGAPDYFPQMKQEIIEVIRKYVHISEEQVSVQLDQNDDNLSVLELNVTLPERP
ncbi:MULTISPECIES: cell division topological specificity factor MinE [Shewanella]|jgi:cell division topological specificity factor|uniref:Cell division topological specificity factor n=2 Tax=Shewanella TaxID=22 RepID=A0A6G7LS38_9GAMM|nr:MULTISPECIES: cell division topological specificity factor MinE [Shewanella]MBZ4679179.1 cell division topological specificity factor MinE [Shewanella sp.]MCA0950089.1 cell division topological specificity factor MinE [Shewanella chilikensis]MCE9787078.1 cell division topological specificity factor MinE [Shewanella chilikensis]MCE9791391.1 cell division topological specificity factor MinE [Shewanella indica]MCE9850699.1 cell division topological specificity factor MinE [Shewanella chilikens